MKEVKKITQLGDGNNYFIPKFYKIDKRTKQTEDEFMLKFNVPLDHDPGQFIQVSIPSIGEAPISICSCNDKYFEMSIRAVGNVTKALAALKEGDIVPLRGPYGRGYDLKPFKGKNIMIIGGGCGVAPVRGIIEYIQQRRKDYKNVDLYFGYRSPKDILFKDDFKRWEEDCKLQITLDNGDKKWKGNVGLITALLEKNDITAKDTVAFLCGPPIMIKFVIELLQKKGFNDKQIWISNERMMKCGTGMCGHCMIEGKYTCKHGPVFRYDEVKGLNG